MSNASNKQLIRQLLKTVYAGDLGAIGDFMAPQFVDHCRWQDRDGLVNTLRNLRRGFTALRMEVQDIIAEGDKVAAHLSLCGFYGGQRKCMDVVSLYRVADGKVVEHWGHSDTFF